MTLLLMPSSGLSAALTWRSEHPSYKKSIYTKCGWIRDLCKWRASFDIKVRMHQSKPIHWSISLHATSQCLSNVRYFLDTWHISIHVLNNIGLIRRHYTLVVYFLFENKSLHIKCVPGSLKSYMSHLNLHRIFHSVFHSCYSLCLVLCPTHVPFCDLSYVLPYILHHAPLCVMACVHPMSQLVSMLWWPPLSNDFMFW